jgi:fermentation-respiration switch protein FrsA (DUF1100 family)
MRYLAPLFTTLLACNHSPGTDAANASPCKKLQVRIGDACERVTVTGFSTEPFDFERAGWTLAGTLYRPEVEDDDYRPPGVVILHGSGPSSRMGWIPGGIGIEYDPPFPAYGSLAEQLALRGFAVLIYDKRSCFLEYNPDCPQSIHDYPGDPDLMTLADLLEDGRSATRALHEALEQDVVVIGHSKGAMFVPQLGTTEEHVSGVVMLAGATLSLVDTLSTQFDAAADYIESIDPGSPLVEQFHMLADETQLVLTQVEAGTYLPSTWLGQPTQFWADWIAMQNNLYNSLVALDLPLYAAFAGADLNVGPEHFEQFETWVSMGVPADVIAKMYPDHTHIFVQLIPEPPGYADEVSDALVDDIADWVSAGQ